MKFCYKISKLNSSFATETSLISPHVQFIVQQVFDQSDKETVLSNSQILFPIFPDQFLLHFFTSIRKYRHRFKTIVPPSIYTWPDTSKL